MAQNFNSEIDSLISQLYDIINKSRQLQIAINRLKSVKGNNTALIQAITDEYLQDAERNRQFNHLTRGILTAAFSVAETGILPAIEAAMDEFDKVKVS